MLLVLDYGIKIVAIGVVPENRRPSSSQAWLLLILLVPVIGLPLFFLIGSPYVHGRRHRIQAEANAALLARSNALPMLPAGVAAPRPLSAAVALNRNLGSLPCVLGSPIGLYPGYGDSIAAMTEAVRNAERTVNFEIYILALDATTEPFFDAMTDAVRRGVKVRLLYDHIGSRRYPGFRAMNRRLTRDGIDWHQMMPIKPLRGRWRRPDLRNHRKLLVVDDEVGFMGSQNMIDSSYLSKANLQARSALAGPERRTERADRPRAGHGVRPRLVHRDRRAARAAERTDPAARRGGHAGAALRAGIHHRPNLRLFNPLIYRAERRLSIVSPYFIPDESLLIAITTAAQRGVEVELFASAKADQFMVHHAQRSYYRALLEAGVRIWLYPAPTVLHTKFLTVDDDVSVIGSSNMDMRSFHLDYEISLMVLGPDFVGDLQVVAQQYRDVSLRLDLESWNRRPWPGRYVDNVMRLTSALQ